MSFFVLWPVSDSWITGSEGGLLQYLGSELKRKEPSSIYKAFFEGNLGKEKDIGQFRNYLFGEELPNRKYKLFSESYSGDDRFVLGTSFTTDRHSVSVHVYDLKEKKKVPKKQKGSESLIDLGKELKKKKLVYSDELEENFKPDWIVGVDFGIRYAAGIFAKKFAGSEGSGNDKFRALTIKS